MGRGCGNEARGIGGASPQKIGFGHEGGIGDGFDDPEELRGVGQPTVGKESI